MAEPGNTASRAALGGIYDRNFSEAAPGLREQYDNLPTDDLRRLAESYKAALQEHLKSPEPQAPGRGDERELAGGAKEDFLAEIFARLRSPRYESNRDQVRPEHDHGLER